MREILDTLASAARATLEPFRTRRRAERIPVQWEAQAIVGGVAHPVEVENISSMGLMARIGLVVLPGTNISINLPEQGTLEGEVRWYREGRFGMCFETPAMLNPAVVDKYRHEADEQAEKLARWMV